MKILILCDMFPPAFGPRMGYLTKYLHQAGHSVSVITEHIEDDTFRFLSHGVDAHHLTFPSRKDKVRWFLFFLLNLLFGLKSKAFVKRADKLIREQGPYDILLCSTYRLFPLPAALTLSQKHGIPLVADLRDILEQYSGDEFISVRFQTIKCLDRLIVRAYKAHLLRQRNKVLCRADAITTVSPWHVEQMKRHNTRVELIFNGYDPELFFPERLPTPRFSITFTGRILSLSMRDPRPLFEAIALLSRDKKIDAHTFGVQWYTDEESKAMLLPLIAEYHIQDFMHFNGYVPANAIPRILNESAILLQLTNKADTTGPQGVMTTKLFESLAVRKPLLCVRNDKGCLEQTIREARAGISASTAQEAYDFILKHYHVWQEKGWTSSETDEEVLKQYSRKEQAEQFANLFRSIIQKQQAHAPTRPIL